MCWNSGITKWSALSLMVIISGGCGAATVPTCKIPDVVELQLEASDRVNADEEGRSLPTLLRVYQLKEVTSLEQSSFEDVWQDAPTALGADLLGHDELTIYPGQQLKKRLDRNPEANFVVAVAVFRQPTGSVWRSVVELPRPGDPCAETGQEPTQPPQATLAISVLLEDYRIESIASFTAPLRGRECDPSRDDCEQNAGSAGDEIRLVGHDGRVRSGSRRPRLPTTTEAPPPADDGSGTSMPDVSNPPRVPSTPNVPSAPSAPSAPQAPSTPSAPSAPRAPSSPF